MDWKNNETTGPCLGGRQALGHMHGDHLEAERLGRLEPGVPDDQHQLLVDHDGLAEPELGDGRLHRVDGGGVVARVPGIGDEPLDRHFGDDYDVPVDWGWVRGPCFSGGREVSISQLDIPKEARDDELHRLHQQS